MKMHLRWTLHVEKFARITSADIEIAPLMCFIGDNNSGKSYIMSLLWGILTNKLLIFRQASLADSYKHCEDWFANNVGKFDVVLDNTVEQMYLAWFNDLLDICKKDLIQKIFNHSEINIGRIELRNFVREKKLSVSIKEIAGEKIFVERRQSLPRNDDVDKISIEIPVNVDKITAYRQANIFICWSLLMTGLSDNFSNDKPFSETVYLPASRTGFLLARREIATKSIESIYSLPDENSRYQETLTAPYIQFLQIMNSLTDSIDVHDEHKIPIINFLQQEIIHGNVTVRADGKVIRYNPEDIATKDLPLSITSSVVTETAALLLLLTNRLNLRLIIIEEPEAHLHPALQKKIAQLLIRFVHGGVPVWITTHSETILQHFNNMIKLNNRMDDDRAELLNRFNYKQEDLLSPDEINVYQFNREESHTDIQKLSAGKYGFIVPSFNQAIDKLMSEIFAFQEDE